MNNLCILGSGIKSIAHLSYESQLYIKKADIVLFLLNEPILENYIKENSKKSYDLSEIYYSTEDRQDCYKKIVDYILNLLGDYQNVCAIFYGHPIFCVNPAQSLIEKAKSKDVNIISCPAISSIDCMFSDLNIDPAEYGMQIYMAQDIINRKISVTTQSYLALLQIGFINDNGHVHKTKNQQLSILKDYLYGFYPESHKCFIYEATLYANKKSITNSITLKDLSNDKLSSLSTLLIPPLDV